MTPEDSGFMQMRWASSSCPKSENGIFPAMVSNREESCYMRTLGCEFLMEELHTNLESQLETLQKAEIAAKNRRPQNQDKNTKET